MPTENRASIGHHDPSLDAAGTWVRAFLHLRSVLPNAARLGNSDQGMARVKTNAPRNHQFMAVPLGIVSHKSMTVRPNQGPTDDKNQRHLALIAALNGSMQNLYNAQS